MLIVGGGLVGPALALAAASAGLRVRVLDAAPAAALADPEFDGRAYAVAAASRRMLRALGLWAGIEGAAQPILQVKVSDGVAGRGAAPLFAHFDADELGEGPLGHIVEDRFLRRALLAAMAESPLVTVETGARVIGQAEVPGGVEVTLADGTTRCARLLVGADGRGSQVARRAGIGRTEWAYRQTSLVAALEVERPHEGIAQQMFFPDGPLAILPLTGNRVSIVWTEDTTRAAAVQAMDDDGYLAALRPCFGDFLGQIRLAGKRYAYPLGLSLATRITAPRLALAGDAAHGIHPLAGQGLNLGLRDVATLAQVLAEAHRRGEDIGAADVLERYRRWRQFDIAALATATDAINRVFSNANPLLRLGRTLALGAIEAAPALRRRLMREAMGTAGDLPVLLQGRAL
ncbi:UbiH/UbiF/VisC/COQ6 family ubiquinone biosynthesis hydroxylase [Halovulum marinum]